MVQRTMSYRLMASPFKHPKLGTYYYRRAVPEHLRALLGKREIKEALGTKDAREAKRLYLPVAAKWEGILREAEQRHQQGRTVTLTDLEIAGIVGDTYRQWLADLRKVEVLPDPATLPDEAVSEMREAVCEDRRIPAAFAEYLAELLQERGIHLPVTADDARMREFADAVLMAMQRKHEAIGRMTAGDYSPDHWESSYPSFEKPKAAADKALSVWIGKFLTECEKGSNLKANTLGAYRASLAPLVDAFGDSVPVDAFTREQAREYRDLLTATPVNRNKVKAYQGKTLRELAALGADKTMHPGTVKKCVERCSTFFKWLHREGVTTSNPFEAIGVANYSKSSTEREAFDDDDIRALFNPARMAPLRMPHQFWLPLLGLYSGARGNELAQLRKGDVFEDQGVWVFSVTDSGKDQTTKNANSVRKVPLHPVLIKLGFLDYARTCTADRLFPDLKFYENGGYWRDAGKWFNERYRKACGVEASGKVFHSFRHTLTSHLLNVCHVPENVVGMIVGHVAESVTRSVYGRHAVSQTLFEAIAKASFPLDIPALRELGRRFLDYKPKRAPRG